VAVEPFAVTVAATLLLAPAAFSVKVVVVKDAAFIGALKFATTAVLTATPVAEAVGVTVLTVGAAPVVKDQTADAASALLLLGSRAATFQ
jgi:hypothetical protein